MVAITVVLAGVIGVMVFGLADDLGDTTPSATLDITDVDNDSTDGEFVLVHDGGDAIEAADISVILDGATNGSVADLSNLEDDETLSAGESVTIDNEDDDYDLSDTESITVTHGPSDSVLASYEIE